MDSLNLTGLKQYIHFGLTSQDINNTSITLSIREFIADLYYPKINNIINYLNYLSKNWKNIVMISKTHGQPAVPSTLGKEIRVFSHRLMKQLDILKSVKYYGKFGGAVGNLNSHYYAYPEINWDLKMDEFIKQFN